MGKPSTDRGGMQQVIRALKADGWALHSVGDVEVATETAAIEEVESTGDEWVYFRKDGKGGAVRFVLGNDPDEVVCDYTVNLTVVDTLTSSWWD